MGASVTLGKKIGVCIIGCGNVSVPHLNAYIDLPHVNVVACCDMNEEAAKKRAQQYGIKKTYTDYKEALKNKEVDVVDICVPAWVHANVSINAMEAGKHVLCEKPIAVSLTDADKMIIASEKNNVKFMVGQSTRYIPLFNEAKKQIEKGEIGRPMIIRFTTRWFNPIVQWRTPQGRKKYESMKSGPIIDAGIHAFDWIRWCLKNNAIGVYTEADTHPEPMPLFTQMHITLEFDDAIGFIELSRTTKGYPSYDRILDVIGTEGKISGFDNSVWTHAKSPGRLKVKIPSTPTAYVPLIENIPYPSEFESEITDFLNSVLHDKPVPVPPEDSRAALEMAIAAKKSTETGKPVKLPLKD